MNITDWKEERRYGERVFKRQENREFTKIYLNWNRLRGWGSSPRKFSGFSFCREHFKNFLKLNSIKITVFFGFFRNNVIYSLFPPGQQNIPCHFLFNLISVHFSLQVSKFSSARKFPCKWKPCLSQVFIYRNSSAIYCRLSLKFINTGFIPGLIYHRRRRRLLSVITHE